MKPEIKKEFTEKDMIMEEKNDDEEFNFDEYKKLEVPNNVQENIDKSNEISINEEYIELAEIEDDVINKPNEEEGKKIEPKNLLNIINNNMKDQKMAFGRFTSTDRPVQKKISFDKFEMPSSQDDSKRKAAELNEEKSNNNLDSKNN